MTVPILTIDGPSGSGKGTIAAKVARQLGWHILDSGALYRLVGLSVERAGISIDQSDKIAEIASSMNVVFDAGKVLLDGEDVSLAIRSEKAGNMASKVAAIPQVRAALLQWQRDFVSPPGLVADGRDMGTVVFPQAGAKIFLDASAKERAKRRYKQLIEKGLSANLGDLISEIQERDDRDRNRSTAPLRAAEDALVIDSSSMSIEEVKNTVLDRLRQAYPHLA
ncbi:MAG: (d)CMP kinase [Chromatiales bacterium]|jgi:cytidylate kinase